MYFVLIWQPDDVPESLLRLIERFEKLKGQSDLGSEEVDFKSFYPKV